MAQEAAVPAGLWQRIQKMIDDSIARYARSGALQNSSITGGQGLLIGPGSKVVVKHPNGNLLMLMGAYDLSDAFDMPDGSRQPMALIARADGTLALAMYDPDPASSDGFQQFLALLDRSANIVVSDDTFSGQGLARPYIPGVFYPVRYQDMTVGTTATNFDTLWRATMYKQQPNQFVSFQATMDTSGATGEVQVLVNGVQLGATQSVTFSVAPYTIGPLPVAGAHMSSLAVEIKARVVSGGGSCKVMPASGYGLQS
jgi:hypothetical protein